MLLPTVVVSMPSMHDDWFWAKCLGHFYGYQHHPQAVVEVPSLLLASFPVPAVSQGSLAAYPTVSIDKAVVEASVVVEVPATSLAVLPVR